MRLLILIPVFCCAACASYTPSGSGSPPPENATSEMKGMSQANVESCAGFSDRSSERLADGAERWTYQHNNCRVSILFDGGYVSKVNYSSPSSDCSSKLERCLRR